MIDLRMAWRAAAVSTFGLLAACNSASNGNAAPRVASIPTQLLAGTNTVALDVSSYTTEREGETVTYQVVSGGGSFTGSTYNNTFETVGSHTVIFTATDASGLISEQISFLVDVQVGELALVNKGSDLVTYDARGQGFTALTTLNGPTVTPNTTLANGHIVFTAVNGGDFNLFVHNPFTQTTTTLEGDAALSGLFKAKTTDSKVVFTVEKTGEADLFLYNAVTGVTRTIVDGDSEEARDPKVNSADLVFYEFTDGSQADIYYYDPETATSTPVSLDSNNEELQAVLPGGGVVFSRVGAGGESDLFFYKLGTGLVEIGADLGATVAAQNKTYNTKTSDDKVVFTVLDGTDLDLYIWNSATGQSRVIANTAVDEFAITVNSQNDVIYTIETGASNHDLAIYDFDTDASATVANSASNETVKGTLAGNGDVIFHVDSATEDLRVWDVSGGSSSSIVTNASINQVKILSNDDVAYQAGTDVFSWTQGSGASNVATGSFNGEASGGDFVVKVDNGGDDDLILWDASADTQVTVSSTTGDDDYDAVLSDGRLLFTRIVAPATVKDLFVWDPTGPSETRLTTQDATTVDPVNYSVYSVTTVDKR